MQRKPTLNFAFTNAGTEPDVTLLRINGNIGRDFWTEWMTGEKSENTIEEFQKKLDAVTTPKIRVEINSYGGDLRDGISIHDALVKHPAQVETLIEGLSASAATIIAQAGNVRKMSSNALYLIHRAMFGIAGYYNQNDLDSFATELKTMDSVILNIYTKRSGKAQADVETLLDVNTGHGRWISAEEALEQGLIDEIIDNTASQDGSAANMRNQAPSLEAIAALRDLPQVPKELLEKVASKDARNRTLQILTLIHSEA